MQQRPQNSVPIVIILAVLLSVGVVWAAQSGSFSVTLVIDNNAPIITWVNSSFSLTPVENQTGLFQFSFNVTDANGASDVNDASASVVVQFGSQAATSTACTPTDNGNTVTYNCSIGLPYYYNASSSWTINASVEDNSGTYVQNASETFTYNVLKAIVLSRSSLSYAGSPGQADVLATEGVQRVYNTGNFDFAHLNLTGYDLNSTDTTVGVGNFTVNVTASGGPGQSLLNATAVQLNDSALVHGFTENKTVYVYLDIPAGATSATYTSPSDWVLDAG